MGCGLRPLPLVATAQNERIELEKELEMPHSEHVDAFGGEAVHKGVSSHHVCDDAVIHAVAPGTRAVG
jgi:hypothetical protein